MPCQKPQTRLHLQTRLRRQPRDRMHQSGLQERRRLLRTAQLRQQTVRSSVRRRSLVLRRESDLLRRQPQSDLSVSPRTHRQPQDLLHSGGMPVKHRMSRKQGLHQQQMRRSLRQYEPLRHSGRMQSVQPRRRMRLSTWCRQRRQDGLHDSRREVPQGLRLSFTIRLHRW